MTTKFNPLAFDEGSAVRLSFDEGAMSVGHVVDLDHVREDGVEFYLVDFTEAAERAPEPQGVAPKDVARYFKGGSHVVALPATILVPVCEWEETYTDEYGVACSEPGVPTSFTIDCHCDAERTVSFDDMGFPGPFHMNLCLEHALTFALEAATEPGLTFIESRPIEDREFTDGEISAMTAVLNVNAAKSNRTTFP